LALIRKKILKIGVTGGIGSGKSEVCTLFKQFGVPVLFADEIAKKLSNTDAEIRKKLASLLGPSAYNGDGSFNRPFVASKIFSNKSLQRKVEAVIHPRVEREIVRQINALAAHSESLVVVEAALIYEAGLQKILDAVVVVDADESVRINRVRKRDAVSEEDVRSRMKAQIAGKKKLEKADYIIYNSGTVEELEYNVRFLYSVFKQVADGGSRV
jgi:dephospho-CoA kinase